MSAAATLANADILKAGDLFRYAAALYEQSAAAWKALGGRQSLADHCAEMADRLAASAFAKCSIVATFKA